MIFQIIPHSYGNTTLNAPAAIFLHQDFIEGLAISVQDKELFHLALVVYTQIVLDYQFCQVLKNLVLHFFLVT